MAIEVEQYRSQLLAGLTALSPVQLPLPKCLGLVNASQVEAHVAVPPFTNSAMDGFAVHAEDVADAGADHPVRLRVIADVPAGVVTDRVVDSGQAVRIMTGAPVPAGADAVVPVELTDQDLGATDLPETVEVRGRVAKGAHIRLSGEDTREGEDVLAPGTVLTPAALAAAAAVGHGSLLVQPRPRVAVIATGAELVAPGQPLDRGQIPDSNSLLLQGLADVAGAEVVSVAKCSDDPADLDAAVEAAVCQADLVVTTGGVSVGTRDVVKNSRTAARMHFVKVLMQPGKPQGFAHLGGPDERRVVLLSLPGNPVSVFVSWHAFALPVLGRLAGLPDDAWTTTEQMTVASGWPSVSGRRQYIPVRISPEGVTPCHKLGSGSHLIASLHRANALAVVPAEVDEVTAGDRVEVLRLGRRADS